jgi:hypothetical protein
MAEKNSLWKNIRNKAVQNKRTGATPKKPTAEMLRQERKIKSKHPDGGPIKRDLYDNPIESKIVSDSTSDRSFYDPRLDQIMLGTDYDQMDDYSRDRLLAHENFHGKQFKKGYSTLLPTRTTYKEPSMVSNDETYYDYHNRQRNEIKKLNSDFKKENNSFNFVPDDIIFNKVTDTAQYYDPATIEGEAKFYEDLGADISEENKNSREFKNGGYVYAEGGLTDDDNKRKYYRRDSPEYKEYLVKKRLNDFSKLPYERKNELLGNDNFLPIFSDPDTLFNLEDDKWNSILSNKLNEFGYERYGDDGEYFETKDYNNPDIGQPTKGTFGSSIEYDYSTNVLPHTMGDIPTWTQYYYNSPDSWVNIGNLLKKYKPSKYHNKTVLRDDFTANTYSHLKNRPNAPWTKPDTKEIEDETNLAELQKYYPDLTKEDLQDVVTGLRDRPTHITNRLDERGDWKDVYPWNFGDEFEENKLHDIDWNAKRGRYYPETIVNSISKYRYPIPHWDEPINPIETLPEIEYLQPKAFKGFKPNNEPLKLSPIETPFAPSKVLIREMGNLDRNREQGEKGLPELYMDDKKGWRPIQWNDYDMYKKQYPGSDTPTGWIQNNKKATGGYMYNVGGPFNKDMSAESQFNDDKLRNTVLNSPLNEGSFAFKPATDWAKNWVSDPEYAARLSQNFPDRSRITKVDTVFQSKKDAREDKREKNLKEAYNYIPRLVGDIGDTKFLYNSNPAVNDQLYKDYSSIYNKEDVADVKRELKDNPQAFTDPYGNAIIRNKANDPGQAGAMSAANHEIWHQLEIPSSKEDMFGNTTYETLDRAYDGKFATPDPSTWYLDEKGQPKMPSKKEFYPMLMQMRMDNNFKPGEEIDDARLDQIRKAGSSNPLFKYFNNEQLKTYLNTFASNQTQAPMQYAARGGYMYDNGGGVGEDGGTKVLNRDGLLIAPTLPEFEVILEANPYGPVTGAEYLESNFNPINWVLPSVEPYQAKFRPDGTLIPASGKIDPHYIETEFIGAKKGKQLLDKAVDVTDIQTAKNSVVKDILNDTKTQLSKAVKGTSSVFNEIKGELKQGKLNRQSIKKGNKWLQNWIKDPATKQKINDDIDSKIDFVTQFYNDPASIMEEINNLNLIRTQSRDFKPNSKEYSLMKQLDQNLQQYLSRKSRGPIHQGNLGVSYRHSYTPEQIEKIEAGLELPASDRYGSWISRSSKVPQENRASTTVHEGVHDWIPEESFKKSGMRNIAIKNMDPEIKKDLLEWEQHNKFGVDPVEKMGKERAYQAYLADPTEMHARIMELRYDFNIPPGYKMDVDHATKILNFIEKGGTKIDPKFLNVVGHDPKKLADLFNRFWAVPPAAVVGAGALQQDSQPQQQAQGGYINPYMYYSGGPMEYGRGGNFLKHLGAGAYSVGEGMLDTITMGATDQLTDKGFEGLTKLGNKNMDLNDPANAKFLKTQQQIKGYGNTAAAVATGIATGNVQGAVTQGAKGLNTAFQASDWATDDFKKWSGISSQAIGIGAGLAGGSLNTTGTSASASEAAGKVGEISGKVSPYVNQAVGMFGSNQQPMWQQAQAQQDLLNSPEYAAQQSLNNQQYVNQGLSFSHGGNITNNSLNLQSMKGRYQNYKQRMSKGGTFNQYGIDMIPDSAGLHHESAYGGVPIGPNALAEGGEIKMDTPDGGQYIVSDQVDGTESQMDFTFSKGGKYKELNRTLAEGMKQDLNRYSFGSLATNSNSKDSLRRPNDSYAKSTIDQIKQKWQQKTEFARQRSQQEQAIAQAEEQKRLIEEEYIAAYGGKINPKKYPGLNRSKKSKGGYVYNAMTQPMLAHGGPVVSNIQQPFNGPAAQNRGGMMMADGGMMQQQGGQDQMMQLIQAYADAVGVSPEEIIEKLQQMDPQSQEQVIQQMAQELQGGQQQSMQQQMPPQQGMMARGGRMRYDIGGSYNLTDVDNLYPERTTALPIEYIKPIDFGSDLDYKDDKYTIKPKGMPSTITGDVQPMPPVSNVTQKEAWYDEPAYSKVARYLPMAASAAGIATGLKNKKRTLTPERISPEQINLERSRITSMEEGRRALDSGLRNVRGSSSNTGQLAANTRDMILNYNKNMGANIAKSYETEENTNAQLRQQSSLANQQYGNQFKQLNEEMFQNAQTMALRAGQEGAMLAQSGAEQERKQYLQEWIAKNRLNTRSYKTNIDGRDVYVSPDGKIYDEQGNPITQ